MRHIQQGEESSWIRYIKLRIKKNKNFLCFISGPTGSGKSWSSLRIAEELDDSFNVEKVVFSGRELMSLINSNKLSKGSCVVFEEAGIEMSNRNWQSVTNKMLNFLLQTFRHRNFILIFNSPYMDFVDAATRKLFHAEMMTAGIDQAAGTVRLKPQLLQYNSRIRKWYYHRLKIKTKEGIVPVTYWNIPKPSPELIEAYEGVKREFTDKLNDEIQAELDNLHGIAKKPLTQKQQEIYDLLSEKMTVAQVAESVGVSERMITRQMELMRNKGYSIMPVKEGPRVLYYEVAN